MLKGRRSILGTTLSDILSPVFCDCPLKYYIKVPIEGDPVGGRTARCRVRRPGSVELISRVRGKADCPLEDFNPAGYIVDGGGKDRQLRRAAQEVVAVTVGPSPLGNRRSMLRQQFC